MHVRSSMKDAAEAAAVKTSLGCFRWLNMHDHTHGSAHTETHIAHTLNTVKKL